MMCSILSSLALLILCVLVQADAFVQINVTVPTTCTTGFEAGHDEVIYTVPYTYDQVMSIIGSYKNLTWSGNPDNTVKLNGTDNTVGTAREYTLMGLHLVETILTYDKPSGGPYNEVHNTALIEIPPVKLYIPYDGTTVTSMCGGMAAQFNFTANFCSNNVSAAAATLHQVHMGDAQTVGKFLGGMNFTSCDALMSMSGSAMPTLKANALTSLVGVVVAAMAVWVW